MKHFYSNVEIISALYRKCKRYCLPGSKTLAVLLRKKVI